MTDISNSIQASTQLQDQRAAELDALRIKVEEFSAEVVRIDNLVADVINQRKDAFYEQFTHLRPRAEMTWFERRRADLASAGEWARENWKLISTVY